MKQRSYNTKHRVKEMLDQGMKTGEIAAALDCSRVNVWQLMRRHNLDEGTRKMGGQEEGHIYSTVTKKNDLEKLKKQRERKNAAEKKELAKRLEG
jgi:uncharacterized protein YjcR